AIRKLIEAKAIEPSLFDERDLAEITAPDYPDQRLIVCHNPLLAEERVRKREDFLQATEKELEKVAIATNRGQRRLQGKDKIGVRVGAVLNKFKVAKHFLITITETSFHYQRDEESISQEQLLDGIYVVRTSVQEETMSGEQVVRSYKSLSAAERAFRCMKTVDLKVRPIHHRLEDRVRAHVFLCMLTYYVEWHMRDSLAPLLFDEDDPEAAEQLRRSVVAKAQRSASAKKKAATKKTPDGWPIHSFQTLLKDLATLTKNQVQFKGNAQTTTDMLAQATPLQQRAFDLLGVKPNL
ncbi:MAG TPA: IS1634 family transposase, partial [Gammaproteobacteria bacterium]|nr:IS1634 family transposase [Gammaproteobacteria bacterium]